MTMGKPHFRKEDLRTIQEEIRLGVSGLSNVDNPNYEDDFWPEELRLPKGPEDVKPSDWEDRSLEVTRVMRYPQTEEEVDALYRQVKEDEENREEKDIVKPTFYCGATVITPDRVVEFNVPYEGPIIDEDAKMMEEGTRPSNKLDAIKTWKERYERNHFFESELSKREDLPTAEQLNADGYGGTEG